MKMAHTIPKLVRIPPQRIKFSQEKQQPTARDNRVILPDLVRYVSETGLVSATPTVDIENGQIIARDGMPFVLAAATASPPLPQIVCACHCAPHQLSEVGLQVVSATVLLDQLQVSMPVEATEMLFFDNPVNRAKQLQINDLVIVAYHRIGKLWGVNEANLLGNLDWREEGRLLVWKWKCMALEGAHLIFLAELRGRIHKDIATIRSWNGLQFP